MKVLTTAAVGLLLGGVVACTAAPREMTDAEMAAVADSAIAIAKNVVASSNARDMAGAFRDLSADSDARFVENGAVSTLETMRASYQEMFPLLELVDNQVDSWDVIVLGPDAAVVTLPIHLRIKSKGAPEVKGQYVLSMVMQHRGGKWQIVQTHESWQHADQLLAQLFPPAKQ